MYKFDDILGEKVVFMIVLDVIVELEMDLLVILEVMRLMKKLLVLYLDSVSDVFIIEFVEIIRIVFEIGEFSFDEILVVYIKFGEIVEDNGRWVYKRIDFNKFSILGYVS